MGTIGKVARWPRGFYVGFYRGLYLGFEYRAMKLLGKLCLAMLGLGAVLTPWVGWGARESLRIAVDDASQWMPPDFPVRRNYDDFRRRFENGDLLIISWEGCVISDPRLQRFVEMGRNSTSLRDNQGRPHLERLVSGAEVVASLCEPPARLTEKQALRRLRGILIGEDGTTLCIATFSPAGIADRARAVATLRACLSECGVAESQQKLAGPVMDGHDVDLASNESLRRFGPLSSAVILVSCYWCLRSWRLAAIVFALSLYCQGATLALIHFAGQSMTPLMIVMPPLILVLGVSGGIHLINYYRDARGVWGLAAAPAKSLQIGWLPCTLSAGTTAIGMASLMISHLEPIQDFGRFAALGVMLTLVAVLLLIPGAFELWPGLASNSVVGTATSPARGRFDQLARWLVRHHVLVTCLSLLALLATAWGVPNVQASVQINTLFRKETRILRDYAWLERHVGPLVPIEVIIHFNSQCILSMYDRLQLIAAVERELHKSPHFGGTMSVATFFPEAAITKSGPGLVTRSLVNREFKQATEQLVSARYLSESPTGQAWRITARSSALDDLDYGRLLDEVRASVEPVLRGKYSRHAAGISHAVTGAMPLVHTLQHELLAALFSSFLSAFAVITAVMIVNQRGILAGLVSMLPNVFPMVILFGFLGWCRLPMDIGSVMTASVALGMAVDGTLHFLTFFRRSVNNGQTRAVAVEDAYRHCAPAMMESTVICGLGLAMFAFSAFLPTNRFAWMMVALLTAALFGDLILLPALLAGPLGCCFRPRHLRPLMKHRPQLPLPSE